MAETEKRTQLYEALASNFGSEVGRVSEYQIFVKLSLVCQAASRKERDEQGLNSISLTYGEIEFKSIYQAFRWIQVTFKDNDLGSSHNAFNNEGGNFVNLGHGTGKGVLAGALMHNFEKCWGIEILQSLQDVSLNLKQLYDAYITTANPTEYEQFLGWPREKAPPFEVILGDIFEIDWADSDFILCNCSCFNFTIMEQIYEKSLNCKKGTWFLTMSKRLPKAVKIKPNEEADPDLQWEHINAFVLQMSWGPATLNIHRKITDPSTT